MTLLTTALSAAILGFAATALKKASTKLRKAEAAVKAKRPSHR